MKYLCTVAEGEVVALLGNAKGIKEGAYYYLEDAKTGTQEQNKAFHALTMEYFKSGMHSYTCDNYNDFRNQIKKSLGAGFESFIYVDMEETLIVKKVEIDTDGYFGLRESGHESKPVIKDAKKYNDIPEYIRENPELKKLARGKLKSWSDYTLKQRKNTIDNLIAEMEQAGVNSDKYQEIMKGLNNV